VVVNSIVSKLKPKQIVWLLIVVAVVALSFVSARYYADYVTVVDQIASVKTLSANSEFTEAAQLLTSIDEAAVWVAPWIESDLESLKAKIGQDVIEQTILQEALMLQEAGSLEEARIKIGEISTEYTDYAEVQVISNQLQLEIETALRLDLEKNEAATDAAEAKADQEAARAQASAATARRAEQERAAANASASAAAREREQSEVLMVEQQANAFVDETVTIFNSLSSGSDELILAIDYGFENVDDMLYHLNRAQTIFSDVEQRASNFYEYRTPGGWEDVPSWLYSASTNYQESLSLLLDAGIAYYDSDTSSREFSAILDRASEHFDTGLYFERQVANFLTEAGR